MSGEDDLDEVEAMMCCASCGIAEVDDIELKECDDCDLVKYCSDDCKEDHRSEHEAKCKERAAELRDEILFRQPESSHLGDCPICCLPLQHDSQTSALSSCCCKFICQGCDFTNRLHQPVQENSQIELACLFCRQTAPETMEEVDRNLMKRIAANDPMAMCHMGGKLSHEGDYEGAFKYWTKAAALGHAESHYGLSLLYRTGEGVEKDEKKEMYHLEEAAIQGHLDTRHQLGVNEVMNSRIERAVKHFTIAANLGHDDSIQELKKCYKHGLVSKDDFAAALRAHHAAVDATKSPEREAAANNFVNFFGDAA